GVVDHVERRDQVVALRQPRRGVEEAEGDAVAHVGLRRVRSRELELALEGVVPDERGARERLGELEERETAPAADVGDARAALELRARLGHRGEPALYEVVLDPRRAEALHPLPELGVIGALRDAAARPERVD